MRVSCLLGLIAFVAVGSVCEAGDFGAGRFARRLNVGPLRHAAGFHGPEVVYRQSAGVATRESAMAWWANSPGHASLINSGKIQSIVCRGRVCVGRGR